MQSFEELGKHFEEAVALERAEAAFAADKSGEALKWLEQAGPSPQRDATASTIHYALAKRKHNERSFKEALEHLHECPRGASVPNFLIEERARLVEDRPGSAVERVEASTCDACSGNDLWRVSTCDHQRDPISPAEKLSPKSLQPDVTRVFASGAYRPGWDRRRGEAGTSLMRRLKKNVDESALRQLSLVLASYLKFHTDMLGVVDALVPIPSRGSRTVARGASIPRLIAGTLSTELGLPLRSPLDARREPKNHSELRGEARSKELADAWVAEEDPVLVDRVVLLVDDITTTGRTLRVAARLLKEQGIDTVHAATIQHTEKSS